jgi:hypothetical protein
MSWEPDDFSLSFGCWKFEESGQCTTSSSRWDSSCLWFESERHNVGSNPQARFSKLMKSNISMSHGHQLNLCAGK